MQNTVTILWLSYYISDQGIAVPISIYTNGKSIHQSVQRQKRTRNLRALDITIQKDEHDQPVKIIMDIGEAIYKYLVYQRITICPPDMSSSI